MKTSKSNLLREFSCVTKTVNFAVFGFAYVALASFLPTGSNAANIIVSSSLNDGAGSLREAVGLVTTGGTITISSGITQIDISSGFSALDASKNDITIIGSPEGTAIVPTANQIRNFGISATKVTFQNLTFMGNYQPVNSPAAVFNVSASVLEISTGASGTLAFIDNQAGNNEANENKGGAVFTYVNGIIFSGDGDMLLFKDNKATATAGRGGAISTRTVVAANALTFSSTKTHVVFTSNTAGIGGVGDAQNGWGGAIYTGRGALTFKGSAAFNDNTASSRGGAIYVGGNLEMNGNTSFTNNKAGDYGGAIYISFTGALTTVTPTISLNANTGDIVFQGNTQSNKTTAVANAIYYDITNYAGIAFNLNTDAGKTIYFYDPINGNNAAKAATAVVVNKTGEGAVLFDRYLTDIAATTTVSAGTFQLGNNAVYGASSSVGTFTLKTGATLAGSGTIRAGTITLESNSTLEARGGGTLALAGNSSPAIGGITLAGNGTIKTGASTNAMAIRAGELNAIVAQTLTLSDAITLTDGAKLSFDLFSGNVSDKIVFDDNVSRSGSVIIDLGLITSGTFALATWNGTGFETADLANMSLQSGGAALSGRYNAFLSILGNTLNLITADPKNLMLMWTGAADNIWKSSASEAGNWTNNQASAERYFQNGDAVVFDDSASASARAISIDGAGVLVASMEVSGSGDYQLSGAGGITATTNAADLYAGSTVAPTGKLTKTGAGTLKFENTATNVFQGGIDILGGKAAFNNNTLRSQGLITIDNAAGQNAALIGTGLLTGNILAKNGGALEVGTTSEMASTLIIDGNLTIDGGVLRIDLFGPSDNDYISILGDLILNGGTIDIGAFASGTFVIGVVGGSVSGSPVSDILVTIGGNPASTRQGGSLSLSGTSLILSTIAAESIKYMWGGGTNVWRNGIVTGGVEFANGDAIAFTDAQGSQSLTVTADGVTVSEMNVSGNANYAFSGGPILISASSAIFSGPATFAPTGMLTKSGNGTLTLGNTVTTARGGVEISGGAIILANSTLSGAVYARTGTFGGLGEVKTDGQGVNLNNGTTLLVGAGGENDVLKIDNIVFHGGSSTLTGSGTLVASGSIGAGATINTVVGSGKTLVLTSTMASAPDSTMNKLGTGTFDINGRLSAGAININEGSFGAMRDDTVPVITTNRLTIAPNAVMRAYGNITAATFENKGSLYVGRAANPAATNRVLSIDGNYTSGEDSILNLQIGSSGTNIITDRLVVSGAISGTIQINFTTDGTLLPVNANWTSPTAIPVTAGQPGASPWDVVSNRIEDADGNVHKYTRADGWLSYNSNEVPAVTGADAASILIGKASIASLSQRLSILRPEKTPHGFVLWSNGLNRQDKMKSVTYNEASARTQGVQIGGDLSHAWPGLNGHMSVGAFYDYAEQNMDQPNNISSTHTEAQGFGIYGVFKTQEWYVDVILRSAIEKYRVSVPGRRDFEMDGDSLAVSVAGGYPYALSDIFRIEPQVQLTYQYHSIDDATDSLERVYRYNNTDSLEARGGLRLTANTTWYEKVPVALWVRGSYAFELRGRGEVTVGKHVIENDFNGGAAVLDGGLIFQLGKHASINCSGAWYYGSAITGFAFDVGLGFSW